MCFLIYSLFAADIFRQVDYILIPAFIISAIAILVLVGISLKYLYEKIPRHFASLLVEGDSYEILKSRVEKGVDNLNYLCFQVRHRGRIRRCYAKQSEFVGVRVVLVELAPGEIVKWYPHEEYEGDEDGVPKLQVYTEGADC